MKLNSRFTNVLVEFFGTLVLSLVLLNIFYNRLGVAFFEALAMGLTLGLLVTLFSSVERGYFNPAIVIAKWTTRTLQTPQALFYLAAQVLAGVVAWTLGGYLLGDPITNIANDTMDWRLFTAEALGAALFGFALAKIETEKLLAVSRAAVVGVSFGVAVMVAGLAGNAIVNPAVALGIQSVSFAYIAGPILGAIVGYNLYGLRNVTIPLRASKTNAKKKPAKRAAAAKTPTRAKRKPVKRPRLNSVRSR